MGEQIRHLRDLPLQATSLEREEIDAAWQAIQYGWDIESREELERQARTNGFKFGLAQAIHHMWKRCVRENPDWLKSQTLRSQLEALPRFTVSEIDDMLLASPEGNLVRLSDVQHLLEPAKEPA